MSMEQAMRTASFIEGMPFTTTALVAMAAWLIQQNDDKGAALLLGFADKFAMHEAGQV